MQRYGDSPVRVVDATVHLLSIPLLEPFTSAREIVTVRETAIIELHGELDGQRATGWGECVALPRPGYTAEYRDGAVGVIVAHLLPLLIGQDLDAAGVEGLLSPVAGNPMAKAAVEMAVLDAELRATNISLAAYLGAHRDRVPGGAAIGLQPTAEQTAAAALAAAQAGYRRIKLKIAPGHDVDVVAAVRRAVGAGVDLQVDANEAYDLADPQHAAALDRLDEFGLLLIEQPLRRDDLDGHARLAKRLDTPICLDESIDGIDAARRAIDAGAADVLCVKPGAVGGYLAARRIHDLAVANAIPLWVGGMLETGLARQANLALAALPGFTLVGDLGATDRYFAADVNASLQLDGDGMLAVPNGPGVGPWPEHLSRFATSSVRVSG